jgi:hypothetical protein
MPINPLELQTNFSQVNQVGKMQSSIKETEETKETQINSLILKEGNVEAEDIPVTKDVSEGVGRIKDEENKKNQNKEKRELKKKLESEKVEEPESVPDLKNPNIGSRIDIVG